MPKRLEHSLIWEHFTKSRNDVNKATCKHCKTDISRGGSNASLKGYTTTNMWCHLRRCHSDKLSSKQKLDSQLTDSTEPSSKPKIQASLRESFDNMNKYSADDPRAIEITKCILEEICVDQEPLDHVNKVGFCRLLKKLCPKYQMVSRTQITQTLLPKMYDDVKSRVKSHLKKLLHVSLTTDIWTSSSSSNLNDFISFTAHGLDEDFNQRSFCLEMMPFEGECHSGDNIAQNIHMAMIEWEIENKVTAIVTDNARNMTCAVNEVNNCSEHKIIHVGCCAHTLQLVLVRGLLERESVKELVSVARKIVGHFSHSTVSMKSLEKEQEELGLPIHVLIQDVPTRWDSTYQMLDRLKEQRGAIQAVLPKIKCQHELSSRQWSLLNQVVEILGFFNQATKSFSNLETTMADVIPIISSIFKVLEKSCTNEDLDEATRGMAQDLIDEMETRFGDLESQNVYILATALDPRYKARVFRRTSTASSVQSLLGEEIDNLSNDTARANIQETNGSINEQSQSSTSTSQASLWTICKDIISEKEFAEPLANFVTSPSLDEVKEYLRKPNLQMEIGFSTYWRKTNEFPKVKKLAQKYLSIRCSSVASEQLFSTAGSIHTDKRNRLKGQNLKMLCFLNKNLKMLNFEY